MPKINVLTGGHKRSAFVLVFEIMALACRFGIGRLGFLTLTFGDQVKDLREGQRRFHSLCTHVLRARYSHIIGVWERQRSGAVHFHLIVVLAADIRTGFDFEAVKRRDYRSACPELRAEWKFWRRTAPRYGFGRTELLPVRSCAEGIARYIGAYISAHVRARLCGDKGARIVRYIGFRPGERRGSCRFGWNTDNGWLWRHKLKAFAEHNGCKDTDDLRKIFGPRWAYYLQAQILAARIDEVHPSFSAAMRSYELTAAHEFAVAVAKDRYERGKTIEGAR